MSEVEAGERAKGGRYLSFCLGYEEYGVEILKVREIIRVLPITRVPRTHGAVLGVINLRGKVIPVLDLKARLGMAPGEITERSCVIVVQARGVELGVLVDSVSEVSDIDGEEVEDAPAMGGGDYTELLLGIAKSEGRVKLLLDIDRVPMHAELEALAVVGREETDGEA